MSIYFMVKYRTCEFAGEPLPPMPPSPGGQVAAFLPRVNQLPMDPPEEELEEEELEEDDLNDLIDPRSWKTWLAIGFLFVVFVWTLATLDTGYQVLFKIVIEE
ncbi:hypothetical protein CDAR_298621 [Caerostris darwini]|uniref:Uncharacterized protein n=1 Tax=Caerostris darwini TaxID=1538125 RepID=A0AAV4MSZ1_9ARAC|nr:hypothetical protein CDAR_298621 [Caerostris darwini]